MNLLVVVALGFLTIILAAIATMGSLFVVSMPYWVELQSPSGNHTAYVGPTHVCLAASSCVRQNYIPPEGCERTTGEVIERYVAVEALFVFMVFLSLVATILTIFGVFRVKDYQMALQKKNSTGSGAGDPTFAKVYLKYLERRKKRLSKRFWYACGLLAVHVFFGTVALNLFDSLMDGYAFCEPLCSYYGRLFGLSSCTYGSTHGWAVASTVLAAFACVLSCVLAIVSKRVDQSEPMSSENEPVAVDEKGKKKRGVSSRKGDNTNRGATGTDGTQQKSEARGTGKQQRVSPQRRPVGTQNNTSFSSTLGAERQYSAVEKVSSGSPTIALVLPEHEELLQRLTGDDWSYAADCELYWSDSQQLYFDPSSLHFYDPASDQWYDPETDEWYTLASSE